MMLSFLVVMAGCVFGYDGQPRLHSSSLFSKSARQVAVSVSTVLVGAAGVRAAQQGQLEYQPALQGLDYGKPRTYYPDFTQGKNGLQYKMVKEGTGRSPSVGDKVVIDWEGYTIGYYGRPFQTRNKVKGGAFDAKDGLDDYFRWVVGSGSCVAALDEGVKFMKEGGVTQIIVPAELGYPAKGDSDHNLVGPKPSTFSGQRALNFVLDNQNLIDKTLLINVRLVKVVKPKEEAAAAAKAAI